MRKLPRFLPAILFAAALSASLLHGQTEAPAAADSSDPGAFYGFWEFQEPAGDSCIVIIKRGGRLSCFWAGTAAKAIQKGTWERTDQILTAHWEDGHSEIYTMLGDNAIERKSFPVGASLLGDPVLTIRGVRVDSRLPGSLTVKRESPRPLSEEAPDPQTAPAIPLNNAFVGFWKIDQSRGLFGLKGGEPNFYLHLARNGDATVALRDWEGDQGVRGKWRIDGDRVLITWPNNRRDVLGPRKSGGFFLGMYKPKDELTREPRDQVDATKVPAADAERFFDAGNFQRLTVVDIRGTWVPRDSTGKREYISIEGWGNAYRYPAAAGGGGTDPGKWRLQNDRVLITWIDGSKDLIRIAFPEFVQDSFTADEPFTGKPTRTVPVMRTDSGED